MSDRGARPVEWLRALALSLERLAAQGVAGGVVRGAADELRSGLPDDLDAQVHELLHDGLTVLGRLVGEAARADASPLETWAQTAGEGAVRGMLEEARRLTPEMRPTTQELLGRVRLWLERSTSEAAERAEVIHAPGDRARLASAGAIAGATEQLSAALPALAEPAAQFTSRAIAGAMEQLKAALPALAGPAGEFASQVGRGLVRGGAEEVGHQLRLARRSPLVRAVAAGVALVGSAAVVALLFGLRRR